jgi:hypothetical protein
VGQRFRRAGQYRLAVTRYAIERRGEMIGERFAGTDRVDDDLAAMFEHLHCSADADRQHECDDEDGYRAAQQRFGGEQAPVCGIGDRLLPTP